jgi:hypothetical protein
MNRHERRRKAAMEQQNSNYDQYIRHLPEVGPEAIGNPGVTHVVCYHEHWCRIYDTESRGITSCNCAPDVRLFAEPKRS